jgi:hypothetical protein
MVFTLSQPANHSSDAEAMIRIWTTLTLIDALRAAKRSVPQTRGEHGRATSETLRKQPDGSS